MKLTRKKANVVVSAIDDWKDAGLLDAGKAKELQDSIERIWLDWKRLARISIRISIVCIIIAIVSLLANEAIMEVLEGLMDISAMGGFVLFALATLGFFKWGAHRKSKKPDKICSTEIIFLFGVVAVAGAVSCFSVMIDFDESKLASLILFATIIYGLLGFWVQSAFVWFIFLCCLGVWLGASTGYASGWGAYYLGMNYPLRFVVVGSGITALGYALMNTARFHIIAHTTRVMGLVYLFVALWIMSIFGNYGDMDIWQDTPKYMLLHWSVIFGAVSLGAIYTGLRRDDGLARNFGITFLFINLYTRLFENFWSAMPKAVFFAVLAASFWFIGVKAETIWSLGGRVLKKTTGEGEGEKGLPIN